MKLFKSGQRSMEEKRDVNGHGGQKNRKEGITPIFLCRMMSDGEGLSMAARLLEIAPHWAVEASYERQIMNTTSPMMGSHNPTSDYQEEAGRLE